MRTSDLVLIRIILTFSMMGLSLRAVFLFSIDYGWAFKGKVNDK